MPQPALRAHGAVTVQHAGAVQHAVDHPGGLTWPAIVELQTMAGNAAVESLLQPKHERPPPDPEPPVQRSFWGTITGAAGSLWGGVKSAASA